MNLSKALIVEGTSEYLVLCYSIYPDSKLDLIYNQAVTKYPSESHFKLHSSEWPDAILLTETRLDNIAHVPPTSLGLMLRSFDFAQCKATICMVDGAFNHYDDLFSTDFSNQIYAFCIKPNEPVIAMDDDIRSSEEWKSIVSKQRQHVA